MKAYSAALVAVAWSLCTSGAKASDGLDAIFARWNTQDTPGCVVGVAQQGKPNIRRAYGMADLERGVKLSTDSVLEAGSVSKQFTASAVLLLVRDGKLRLDDKLGDVLPEIQGAPAQVTIEQLLTHTSGLHEWSAITAMSGVPRRARSYTMADVLHMARRSGLNYEPGTAFLYNNTGFILAALIVERVSQESFDAFMQRRIFAPLGMKNTRWRDDHRRIVQRRALAYVPGSGGTWHLEMPIDDVVGAGGLLTTIDDLLRWNAALQDGTIDGLVGAEMTQTRQLSDGRPIIYARGLFVETFRGLRQISHSGATAGYRAWSGWYPEKHVTIALLCNHQEAIPATLAHQVLAQVAGSALSPVPPHVTLSPDRLARRAGFYRSKHGEVRKLTVAAGGLRLGGSIVPLAPFADDQFGDDQPMLQFLGEDAFRLTRGEGERFQRVAPSVVGDLDRYVGRFSSREVAASIQVTRRGDVLELQRNDEAAMRLTPIGADTFEYRDGFVLRFAPGAGPAGAFEIGGDGALNVRFERDNSLP